MKPPQIFIFVLPSVHPVDIEIVSDCEKEKLKPNRQIGE
jgi:hypothetical protein